MLSCLDHSFYVAHDLLHDIVYFTIKTLLCTCSNGELLVLTRLGKVVCRLNGKVDVEDVSRATFSHAVAGMVFLPLEKREEEEGR